MDAAGGSTGSSNLRSTREPTRWEGLADDIFFMRTWLPAEFLGKMMPDSHGDGDMGRFTYMEIPEKFNEF